VGKVRIGIVAPGRRLGEATQARLEAFAAQTHLPIELVIHPQCQFSHGHFAGTDSQRLEAFLTAANDPTLDAIWFARGGYGAARLLQGLADGLNDHARSKVYLGYSDMGFLLSALMGMGCQYCAHGPLAGDLDRVGGEGAVLRALRFLARQGAQDIAEGLDEDQFHLAFNLTILRSLLATPWLFSPPEPVCLWLEDVGEYTYATDRSMFQLTNSAWFKDHAQDVRIGRFSHVPDNDVQFSMTSVESVTDWCRASGRPTLLGGDIGHDSDNKIVPFGRLRDWRAARLV
jgi:muramoyltetrapeptide carboxypeptidase